MEFDELKYWNEKLASCKAEIEHIKSLHDPEELVNYLRYTGAVKNYFYAPSQEQVLARLEATKKEIQDRINKELSPNAMYVRVRNLELEKCLNN